MIIKNPGKSGHGSFRLMQRKGNGYETVAHPDLDTINKEYAAGMERDRARLLVERLRDRLEASAVKPVSWLPENMQIAEAYLRDEIAPKQNKRPQAAIDRVKWAVRQLGSTPVLSSTKAEIVAALSNLDANSRRRAISVLNSLLKYKGVPTRIPLPKHQKREIDFLSPDELKAVLAELPQPEWRLLASAAFGCGARYGELFALEARDLRNKGKHVHVGWQRLQDWSKEPTKNDKEGTAFVIPEYRTALVDWIKVDAEIKKEMRRKEMPGEYFAEACERAIGRRLTFHNLRHSYAHYMLGQGADLIKLKKWMRDRMSTIEDYYLGWVQQDSELEGDATKFG